MSLTLYSSSSLQRGTLRLNIGFTTSNFRDITETEIVYLSSSFCFTEIQTSKLLSYVLYLSDKFISMSMRLNLPGDAMSPNFAGIISTSSCSR